MSNLRGIVLMIAAMFGFALEDMIMKSTGATVPPGQIIIVIGLVGGTVFVVVAKAKGDRIFAPDHWRPKLWVRMAGETIGTMGFITAIVNAPLSTTTAIFQATPLAMTAGAAIFLKELVGWRRWMAIFAGFCGVLIVIRPGTDAFEPMALFALFAVFGLALRDLVTRTLTVNIPTRVLAIQGLYVLIPAGVMLTLIGEAPVPMTLQTTGALVVAALVGALSYFLLASAMRMGEVSAIIPFRYTRLIFAILIGITVFHERPDFWTYAGAAIIIGSGLFTILRERALARRTA